MPETAAEPYAIAPCLDVLLRRENLSPALASEFMTAFVAGRVPPASLGAFLAALRAKGETEDELAAFAAVLRAHARRVQAPEGTLDTCGTGGDSSGTFNVSTAVALVVAGMGIPVAKHGNRSVSSNSGSADVLKVLGVNVEAPLEVAEACLREVHIGFFFAPAFHPGMRHAAPVRRELGIRTVFNLLGPLINPAFTARQLMGVFDPAWCEPLARVLQQLGSASVMVVCGAGPGGAGHLDEISTFGPTRIARLHDGVVRGEDFIPASLGLAAPEPKALAADGPEASARTIRAVLDGKPGPAREIVLLNAAAAALVAYRAGDWRAGFDLAAETVDSGRARDTLARLVERANRS
ncbi:MAG: anthranilate phosphoribosyltransferase [Planctomycetota bacterium]|nr:anthranilate phosphoribosyltransferase [Planctomycetota bacterium]